MAIQMRREKLKNIRYCDHAGLWLHRGFKQYDDGSHNDDYQTHHRAAGNIKTPSIYEAAYKRWKSEMLKMATDSTKASRLRVWAGALNNRLYIGTGDPSSLEAGIRLQHSYGVPFIPGTAIKGIARHYAEDLIANKQLGQEAFDALFGIEPNREEKLDSGEAGYITFHDAWWIPGSAGKALVPEIITVHHSDYYASQGEIPATDFDDPNPNPQIAIEGSFLFVLEGDEALVDAALGILCYALGQRGIGAKTSSGYGLIKEDSDRQDILNETLLSDEKRLKMQVQKLTLDDLEETLGKGRNKTAASIGEEKWESYLLLVKEKFNEGISSWNKKSEGKFKQRAYKTINGLWKPSFDNSRGQLK